MGLRMKFWPGPNVIKFILHKKNGGEGSFEFVDEDLDSMLAFKGFGDTEYDTHLDLYETYTEDGLEAFILRFPEDMHEAFEDQGYDVFDDESFDKSEFLSIIGQVVRDYEGEPVEEIIDILNTGVVAGDYSKDAFVDDLIKGLEVAADPDMDWPDEEAVLLYLTLLKKLLPDEAFKFKVGDPDRDEIEWDLNDITIKYDFSINDYTVFSWFRRIYGRITNPLTFDVVVDDPCDDDPEGCPPMSAYYVMEVMGWYYPADPEAFTDLPESDYSGDFGVAYTKHEVVHQGAPYYFTRRTGEVFEPKVIPYETLEEAKQAAKLSSNILESKADNSYDIDIVTYDNQTQEWVPYEEEN